MFYVPRIKMLVKINMTYAISNIVVFNPQYIPMDSVENQVIKRMFDLVFWFCNCFHSFLALPDYSFAD